MNWKLLIKELLDSGMTQVEIANFIGVKQPSIVDILQDRVKSVRWDMGDKILKLHKKIKRKAA